MQQLEYTPSVRFDFDDTTNRKNMSAELFFQLSCTNHKQEDRPFQKKVQEIHLDEQIAELAPSKLKTQKLFEDFHNNFIVTFDGELISDAKTAEFKYDSSQVAKDIENFEATTINYYQTNIEKLDLCHLQQNSKPSIIKKEQQNFKIRENSIVKPNECSSSTNEKDSPIEFQVKKRTVFKNKKNIASNAQQFKITNKKVILQNLCELFPYKSHSCKSSKPKEQRNRKSFTSQLVITKSKKTSSDFPLHNLKIETGKQPSIFLEPKQTRESLRPTTLNNWKRKFQRQRKSNEQKTAKKTNIFQNIFLVR